MTCRPPLSALFPYTTLFRSAADRRDRRLADGEHLIARDGLEPGVGRGVVERRAEREEVAGRIAQVRGKARIEPHDVPDDLGAPEDLLRVPGLRRVLAAHLERRRRDGRGI